MKIYTQQDILRLGKRYNNKKRSYLLVNTIQAKHIPASPSESLDMMYALGDKIAAKYPDVKLVIGFAETATAIGAAAASRFSPECVYIHTTRENIGENFIGFKEEHSHAVEQKLYNADMQKYIASTNEIVLVDDEFSTGKTLLNIVGQLKEKYPDLKNKKIIAASVINRLTEENSERLLCAGIECEYLVKLPETDYTAEAEKIDITSAAAPAYAECRITETELTENYLCPRKGVIIGEYQRSCERIAEMIFSQMSGHLCRDDDVLVIGTEEFMYPAIIAALKIEPAVRSVKCHATTRSPIGINNAEDYPARNGYKLPGFYDNARETYIYNLKKYDKVIIMTDSGGDVSEALNSLTSALAAYGNENIFFIREKMFGTYKKDDVVILLKDISGLVTPLPTEEREKYIQSGVHYSEMLPLEYEPSEDYLKIYNKALELYSSMTAKTAANAAEKIWKEKGSSAVLVSLARAGTPVGILLKHYIRKKYNCDIAHYTISIIRGKSIDRNAMNFILKRHNAKDIQFVDGWTGKGAIQRELDEAMKAYPEVSPGLAVLSDPAGIAQKCGTREDFLIASSCLNSTVSGLLSRTFYRKDIIGENDFHGAVFYRELIDKDLTYQFIDSVEKYFDTADDMDNADYSGGQSGLDEVREIAEKFGIRDINFVKPGIGETTRVLLRRMPWKILVRSLDDNEHLGHLYQLAKEKGAEVTEYPLKNYRACGLIRNLADS